MKRTYAVEGDFHAVFQIALHAGVALLRHQLGQLAHVLCGHLYAGHIKAEGLTAYGQLACASLVAYCGGNRGGGAYGGFRLNRDDSFRRDGGHARVAARPHYRAFGVRREEEGTQRVLLAGIGGERFWGDDYVLHCRLDHSHGEMACADVVVEDIIEICAHVGVGGVYRDSLVRGVERDKWSCARAAAVREGSGKVFEGAFLRIDGHLHAFKHFASAHDGRAVQAQAVDEHVAVDVGHKESGSVVCHVVVASRVLRTNLHVVGLARQLHIHVLVVLVFLDFLCAFEVGVNLPVLAVVGAADADVVHQPHAAADAVEVGGVLGDWHCNHAQTVGGRRYGCVVVAALLLKAGLRGGG